MRWMILAAGIAAATVAASVGHADEAEANRLLLEAIGLAEQAARVPRDEAIHLYEQAAANLDAIVAEHPDSPYAVLIATGQPIGSFRIWEVRRELARLTASIGAADAGDVLDPAADAVACATPCVWEHQYGAGTTNALRGDPTHLMADVIARPDGSVIAVGNYWHDGQKEIWLVGYGADGSEAWQQTHAGTACDAAPLADGIAVLAQNAIADSEYAVIFLLTDGPAPATVPIGFEPTAIEPDGRGGFLVMGARNGVPVIQSYGPAGDLRWTAGDGLLAPGGAGVATAATVLPGSSVVAVLGYQVSSASASGLMNVWSATIDGAGTLGPLVSLAKVQLASSIPCDFYWRPWSIDAAGDGVIVRYDFEEPLYDLRRSVVARLDATGRAVWSATHPVDPPVDGRLEPDSPAAADTGVDELRTVSATADGGAILSGYRNRPLGAGAGFVARWDADGTELWRTELRRSAEDDRVRDAYFAAAEETADGGVVAVMNDGLITMRIRAFIFRLGPNGEGP